MRTHDDRQHINSRSHTAEVVAQQQGKGGVSLVPPALQLQAGSGETKGRSVPSLWEEFQQARAAMYSEIPLPGPDATTLALAIVDRLNQEQARKYGLELYLWLETFHPAKAPKALQQFESSWEGAEIGKVKETFDWADRRKPIHLLGFAEQAYTDNQLTDCTSLLRAALSIAQYQLQNAQAARQGVEYRQREAATGEIGEIKTTICRICSFYDWKALYESRLDHSEKLPYLPAEAEKVRELLATPEILTECTPEREDIPEPVHEPEEKTTDTPYRQPPEQTEEPPEPAPPVKVPPRPSAPEYKSDDPKVQDKDDRGINLKFNIVLPKKTLVRDKRLGRFIDLDSVDFGGEIEVLITLLGNRKADSQETLAEIEIDGKKKLVGIKKEMEQKLLEGYKTENGSLNLKMKEGLSFNPETQEVGIGLEGDFWGTSALGVTFKIIEIDKGKVNVGVVVSKLAVSLTGIAKHLGFDADTYLTQKAQAVLPGLKGLSVNPKAFIEARFSPNYTEILKELGKRGVKWAAERAAATAASEGVISGFAAVTAVELATLGVGAAGGALTLGAVYLSMDDDDRMWAAIGDAKRSCRDFRLGFLSGMGYTTSSVSKDPVFFKDGQRAGAQWFGQMLQRMKAQEGTAEYDLAQEGTSDEDLAEIVKIKLTETYEQSQMYNTIGLYTGVAEHQIKELHIAAWRQALGWREEAKSYEYEERIIRTHLFPKYDIHGKPIR